MSSIAQWRRSFKSAIASSHAVARLLSASEIERRCREVKHRWRKSIWSPGTTLMAFIFQSLNGCKTLRAAVADILDQLLAASPDLDLKLPSSDPSAFCDARQRLPEAVIESTLRETIERTVELADTPVRWLGRRTWIVDGSSVSMSDESELQEAFPQPSGQKKGCGFPVMRLLAVFCWGTGALLDPCMGSLHDAERTLFRRIFDHFSPGDVVLADRGFCSYVDIARLVAHGCDVVFRLHQRRPSDFTEGQELGPNDCLVTWNRPQWIPSFGLSREEFEALPKQMTLRMVRRTHTAPGFRSQEIVIVTTILDPREASAEDLLALYGDRWMAEVNLRSLKTHLKMDVLRGKSVDIVRKEVLMHALLYNLIRLLMWEAAKATGKDPRRLSFTGTLHRLQSLGRSLLVSTAWEDDEHARIAVLLAAIAADVVPERENRVEPRRVKRRPKNYSHLTKPRAHYRAHGDNSCR